LRVAKSGSKKSTKRTRKKSAKQAVRTISCHQKRLINRELSWLEFNHRVLEQAQNKQNPVLERLKFLSIFESNLDEFIMVRLSGLMEQADSGVMEPSPDGLMPIEQVRQIMKVIKPQRKEASRTYLSMLKPALSEAGVNIRCYRELSEKQKQFLKDHFEQEIYPLCTPLILHPAPTVPFISSRSLNLAVELEEIGSEPRLARVKVPTIVPRMVKLPGRKQEFVFLEEIIQNHLETLFPGVKILGSYMFRIIRDADVEIRELEAADLITSIEDALRLRRFGDAVLLEVQSSTPDRILGILFRALELDPKRLLQVQGPLGYEAFGDFGQIERSGLRYPPHIPYLAESISSTDGLFESISADDILVHHPYDSFRSIEEFVNSAAVDPNVIGIKQTLYRVGSESPIVESLLDAAESGKQVAVMVELKARFDENNNLVWARALERAGVHVTYGFAEMKTHCKLCLIVRREDGKLKQYAHIGTGNYNPLTARSYTDFGLFTCDPQITQDISELFNALTGFSRQNQYRKLLVAPTNLREKILELIQEEIKICKESRYGRIILKLNSLVDPEAVEALYEASQAGVSVDLLVRGICCLRPGVPGMSENIRVSSMVGRFLEHSRAYFFGNRGEPKVYIGSADLMRRNLDRRIEVLTPVEEPDIIRSIEGILETCLRDNQQTWDLLSDGSYVKRKAKGGKAFNAQIAFMREPRPPGTSSLISAPQQLTN